MKLTLARVINPKYFIINRITWYEGLQFFFFVKISKAYQKN